MTDQSILGRPLKERKTKLQLQMFENEEFVPYSLPSQNQSQKNTHNFFASVASNGFGEKKH